jgi:hypothetical protein
MPRRQPLRDVHSAPGPKSTVSDRVKWLLVAVWNGNRSEMARAAGVSHSIVTRVVLDQQSPGRRFLQALAAVPKISPAWLLSGEGLPLLAQSEHVPAAGWPVPISTRLLSGSLEQQRHLCLNEFLPVAGQFYSPNRYWFRIGVRDAIVAAPHRNIAAGDLLLLETDSSAWQDPSQVGGRLCSIVMPHTNIARLGAVDWDPGDGEDPPGLTAEIFEDQVDWRNLINRFVVDDLPDGTVTVKKTLLRRLPGGVPPHGSVPVRNLEFSRAHQAIHLRDIAARCELILRQA